MDCTLRRSAITRPLLLLLCSTSLLWGCAGTIRSAAELQRAAQAREDAYEKLGRAMSAVCSIKHRYLEERVGCLVEQRLELARLRQINEERARSLSLDASDAADVQEPDRLVQCERTSARTICYRKH